jgi:hypothetical protein
MIISQFGIFYRRWRTIMKKQKIAKLAALAVLVIIIVVVLAKCGGNDSKKFVGTWTATESSYDYADTLVLNSDGTGTGDGLIPLTWTCSKGKLRVTAAFIVSRTYEYNYEFKGSKTLVLTDTSDNSSVTYTK